MAEKTTLLSTGADIMKGLAELHELDNGNGWQNISALCSLMNSSFDLAWMSSVALQEGFKGSSGDVEREAVEYAKYVQNKIEQCKTQSKAYYGIFVNRAKEAKQL